MEASLDQQRDEEEEDLGSFSSFGDDDSESVTISASSECMEDVTSRLSESSNDRLQGPLVFEMASLIAQLPFKRGISQHFQGKSQSFTSLSNVRSLEDLAKPEKPYKKKLKPRKSQYKKVLNSPSTSLGRKKRAFRLSGPLILPRDQSARPFCLFQQQCMQYSFGSFQTDVYDQL